MQLGELLAFRGVWLPYVVALGLYYAWFRTGRPRLGRWATSVLSLGLFVHVYGLVRLGLARGGLPPMNLGETLSVLAASTSLVYLYVEVRGRDRGVGALAVSLICVYTLGAAAVGPATAVPEVLRSQLFAPHAAAIIAAFASFTMSAFLSMAYLLQYRQLRSRKPGLLLQRLPDLQTLEFMTRRANRVGFVSLTLGLLLGAALWQKVFGTLWEWDPKQCMTLLTWLLYGTALGLRRLRDWQGGRIATVNLVAFASVVLGMALMYAVFDTAHRFG